MDVGPRTNKEVVMPLRTRIPSQKLYSLKKTKHKSQSPDVTCMTKVGADPHAVSWPTSHPPQALPPDDPPRSEPAKNPTVTAQFQPISPNPGALCLQSIHVLYVTHFRTTRTLLHLQPCFRLAARYCTCIFAAIVHASLCNCTPARVNKGVDE